FEIRDSHAAAVYRTVRSLLPAHSYACISAGSVATVVLEDQAQIASRRARHVVHEEAAADLDEELACDLAFGVPERPDEQPMRADRHLRHHVVLRLEVARVQVAECPVAHFRAIALEHLAPP